MKKVLIFLCLVVLAFSSCSKEEDIEVVGEISENELVESVSVETEENVDLPEDDVTDDVALPEVVPEFTSNTTGLPCTEEEKLMRPIAVMYNNNKISYPQIGISGADIVYECDAEGGVTRLMAIFSDWKNLGEIGSVRSARDYFITLSELHGAVYVNAGGSPSAYEKLYDEDVDYVDGVNMNDLPDGIFYRSNYRIKHNGYEHSLMTDGSKIAQAIDFCGYSDTYSDDFVSPLKFSSDKNIFSSTSAQTISLTHSSYVTVKFVYNEELGTYSKYSFGLPHVDGLNGEQLNFENLLVLFTKQNVLDSEGRLDIDTESGGEGYYFNDGKCVNITWAKKGSAYAFFAEEGEVFLIPGKTHITLFNKNNKDKITIK